MILPDRPLSSTLQIFLVIAQNLRLRCRMCGVLARAWVHGRPSGSGFLCARVFSRKKVQGFHNFLSRGASLSPPPLMQKRKYHGQTAGDTTLHGAVVSGKAERWQGKHQPAAAPFSRPERSLAKGPVCNLASACTHCEYGAHQPALRHPRRRRARARGLKVTNIQRQHLVNVSRGVERHARNAQSSITGRIKSTYKTDDHFPSYN